MRLKILAAMAAVTALYVDAAAAQAINLQSCPATKLEASALISKLKQNGEAPGGTISFDTSNLRFQGDPVQGLYTNRDTGWLHIRLPRGPSAYAAVVRAAHAADAARVNCDEPDKGCYIRMNDKRAWGLYSLDFSTFEGRFVKEGEPDGRYLICFY
ncbi:hypothetical protein HNP52_001845 [Sphingomonas kyeonggiensis]|uniref:Uncharacterized protein n=1 Tax=Sphingomonas kyeonggiensis TaxID=1268553 RepID=A0A7W7K170_9SPHN|nr:hypothetical protein [Sphingomonas kyeonggiensis]MBB4838776.1 hypothetical protein [Sphingomonas kyeonggiensis]